jgi:hypothetical protein
VGAQLGADAADVGVDGPLGDVVVLGARPVDELGAGEDEAGALEERGQDPELGGGEIDAGALDPDLVAGEVDLEAAVAPVAPGAGAVRRRTVLTRAASSRGLKGLVT